VCGDPPKFREVCGRFAPGMARPLLKFANLTQLI
jgi:hypothetical protein